jgi:hypothetical protein
MKLATVFRKYQVVQEPKKEKKQPMMIEKGSKFIYTKGSDVLKTFKRHGFVPPSEYREDYLFKKNREMTNE